MTDLTVIGNSNLRDLPGSLFLKIRDHLDVNEQNCGWRAFVAVLEGNYTLLNIAACERAPSPTTKLLESLGTLGMTINEFVHYAYRAENFVIMNFFNVYVPAQITQNPLEEINVMTGERVDIVVRANGFPPPQFQWHKDGNLVPEANHSSYQIDAASLNDAGVYCCEVFNSKDPVLLKFSKPTTVIVQTAPALEIKEHPQSCIVAMEGNALFKCEVWGGNNVSYQWCKDQVPLCDGEHITGATTNELRLYKIISRDWMGCYSCTMKQGNQDPLTTQSAVLKISNIVPKGNNYTARDKVALLIGCNDYRSDHVLTAPKYDVQTLSNIFQSLHFKVVSLLNLTLVEMLSTLRIFQKLVEQGVYCVFYFCGHGFENAHECYLVPIDAPIGYQASNCISADKILSNLLKKDPQVCCMILDICRKLKEDGSTKPAILGRDTVVEKGNTIICYGTSYGLAAYEDGNYGILVSHLKKVLSQPYDFDTVFKNLRDEIKKDPKVNKDIKAGLYKQIPEIRSNLLEVDRSFTDRIDHKGYTEAFNQRQMIWERAHKTPDPVIQDIQFPGFTVKIRLDFQQEFSNVLKIFTSVLDQGPALECLAYISSVSAEVAEKAKTKNIVHTHTSEKRYTQNYTVIHNIQRLKSNMHVTIAVTCLTPHTPEKLCREERIDLGLPLIAVLKLGNEDNSNTPIHDNRDDADHENVQD